ncbi:hypothetical protein SLS62_007074 [Diatrype stigma]|uniref:Fucose-specific lectin n=1 Tax=Diatrype stigma TaxID=117547 RepID=A0AAN9UQA5_9PEZI
MQNQQQYSDLEVVDPPSDGPYVYESPAAQEANLPEVVSPAPPRTNKDADEKIVDDATKHDERKGGPLGVFHRRRLRYLIFTLIALTIVGAVLGAALGTTLNHRSQETDETTTNPPAQSPANRILRNSSLTATNLADQNGRVHRRVFFQDANNAIIARQWDSQNRTWETRNLTEAVHLNPATPDIDTYPGTPLASASLTFRDDGFYESWVWFLDSGNQIINVGSGDISYSEDRIGVISLPGRFVAGNGSRLAAAWQRCPEDCMGSWIVIYQAEDGLVNVINGSGSWHLGSSFDRAVAMGSSLAITPQMSGSSATGLAVLLENLVSGSTGEVIRMGYGMPETDGHSWVDSMSRTTNRISRERLTGTNELR